MCDTVLSANNAKNSLGSWGVFDHFWSRSSYLFYLVYIRVVLIEFVHRPNNLLNSIRQWLYFGADQAKMFKDRRTIQNAERTWYIKMQEVERIK
jgi:hypothetical protein